MFEGAKVYVTAHDVDKFEINIKNIDFREVMQLQEAIEKLVPKHRFKYVNKMEEEE